jgi:hypothetical protein
VSWCHSLSRDTRFSSFHYVTVRAWVRVCSDNYSSVTSANIDHALSDGNDDDDDAGSGSRHVAFSDVAGDVMNAGRWALHASYAVRRSCFERGRTTRQTLSAFTANDLDSTGHFFFRHGMMTSPAAAATTVTGAASKNRQQLRPRSKSVERSTRNDGPPTTCPESPARHQGGGEALLSVPVAVSTLKSAKSTASVTTAMLHAVSA